MHESWCEGSVGDGGLLTARGCRVSAAAPLPHKQTARKLMGKPGAGSCSGPVIVAPLRAQLRPPTEQKEQLSQLCGHALR